MIVVGIGGNVGGEDAVRARFVLARAALAKLGDLGELGALRSAALYRTAPIGPAQPPFLNSALALDAEALEPGELIGRLLALEATLGRHRADEARWGPRAIDLDILVWGTRVIAMPALVVPHPRLGARRFALAPLVDLVGAAFEIPGVGPAGAALERVGAQDVTQVSATW